MPPKNIAPHPAPHPDQPSHFSSHQSSASPAPPSPSHQQRSLSQTRPSHSQNAQQQRGTPQPHPPAPHLISNVEKSPGPSKPNGQPAPVRSASYRGPGTVADAVAASLGSKRERKRKRIHYSCAECHRRKHKCDRQTPCQPCIDRGLGDSCRPFEDGDQFGDMRDRVQRLEDIVEGLAVAQAELAKELSLARKRVRGLHGFDQDGIPIETISSEEENDDGQPGGSRNGSSRPQAKRRRTLHPASLRGMEREELYNSEAQANIAIKGETIDSAAKEPKSSSGIRYDEGGNPLEGGLARDGDSWFGALALPSVSRGVIETEINGEKLELGANFPRYPASVKLHRLIHEGGAPENILSELMSALPSKSDSDRLLDIYFRDINHTRLPIHEGTFRQSYEELMEFRWGDAKEERGDDGARHVPFLAFLFVVLATAMRSLPEELGTEAEGKKGAMKLYHACRKTIVIASTIRVDHIDLVLAHLFAARFLIVQRQSAESWSLLGNAIRAAQAIGLHRDGSRLGLDAVTTERRRRLWALIFYMDKTTSILLGRPQAIQEFHCDTLPPSDIDIDTMPRAARPYVPRTKPRLNTPPGIFLFVAIRHELARLTGKIVEHFQNLSAPRKYSDVIALDAELEKFRSEIPNMYRLDRDENGNGTGTDKSFDQVCPWLPLHRYLLNIEYHYVRIALHRPYVLRNNDKYAQSRTAAFESARSDRMVRREYRKDVQWSPDKARKTHMGGLYRLFNATMMIGIALLLDPNGPEAPEFMTYLDEFIELHRHRQGDTDQCSKREVKIIELFRAKAKDPTWCATTAATQGNGNGKQRASGPSGSSSGAADGASGNDKGAEPRQVDSSTLNGTNIGNGQTSQPASQIAQRNWYSGVLGGGYPSMDSSGFGTPGASGTSSGINYSTASPTSAAHGLGMSGGMVRNPAGQSASSDGITPPPYTTFYSNGGIGFGTNVPNQGQAGGVHGPGTSNSDGDSDLAQSIFDQLGGFEPFSMLGGPNSTDGGLSLGGSVGVGFGSESNTISEGFDPSNQGFDLASFWNATGGAQHSGGNSDLNEDSPSNFVPVSGSGNATTLNATAGQGNPKVAASSSGGGTKAINVPTTTSSIPSTSTIPGMNIPVKPGASGDWGLLPWGGLIEAIAQSQSSHILPHPEPEGESSSSTKPTTTTNISSSSSSSSSATAAKDGTTAEGKERGRSETKKPPRDTVKDDVKTEEAEESSERKSTSVDESKRRVKI
ncbi:hypothetical protein IE53DRAFT_367260 [Violaceomyces palustris]|uniref:Uncharacterized protein n=1 Tax=Violaceomyces palustris TaxID=1673888 RepID=A0ACD0P373_9BASI|nr:hypothetical protein IE53DRAFT_367260 [Violaceomyces palustris]